MDLLGGACYLVEDGRPDVGYRVLLRCEAGHRPCLCVSRLHPGRVRSRYRLSGTPVVWLTELPGKDYQSPKSLTGLANGIEAFVTDHAGDGVILLDGIEYLILQNGFDPVLAFVEHLLEAIAESRAVVLLPVNPKAFTPTELARLERDLEVPDVEAWRSELDARDWSPQL